jgi:hypothetical protein
MLNLLNIENNFIFTIDNSNATSKLVLIIE